MPTSIRASVIDGGPDMAPKPPIARKRPGGAGALLGHARAAPTWPPNPQSLGAPRGTRGAPRSQGVDGEVEHDGQMIGADALADEPSVDAHAGGDEGMIDRDLHHRQPGRPRGLDASSPARIAKTSVAQEIPERR